MIIETPRLSRFQHTHRDIRGLLRLVAHEFELALVANAGYIRLQIPGDEQLLLFTEDAQRPGCDRKLNLRNIGCLQAKCHLQVGPPQHGL